MANFLDPKRPTTRALLVGVQTPDMRPGEGAELLAELNELVENLGLEISHSTLINLRDRQQPKFLIGTGKVAELIARARADGADVIVIDEELTPAQQRNWEEESGLAVIDRQEVILEIFADRAQTREAVLQVALARMEYSLPRLTRAWSHLSRQRGKGKMGGEGETQLEQDRRLVRNRITRLKASTRRWGRRRMKPTVSVSRSVRPSGSTSWRVVGSRVAKSLSAASTCAPVSWLRRVDLPALV
jgi:GTPase